MMIGIKRQDDQPRHGSCVDSVGHTARAEDVKARRLSRLRSAQLTDRQLACLAMYYFDGLSQSQIGCELGIGERSVGLHIRRGANRLAAIRLEPRRIRMECEVTVEPLDIVDWEKLSLGDIRAVW